MATKAASPLSGSGTRPSKGIRQGTFVTSPKESLSQASSDSMVSVRTFNGETQELVIPMISGKNNGEVAKENVPPESADKEKPSGKSGSVEAQQPVKDTNSANSQDKRKSVLNKFNQDKSGDNKALNASTKGSNDNGKSKPRDETQSGDSASTNQTKLGSGKLSKGPSNSQIHSQESGKSNGSNDRQAKLTVGLVGSSQGAEARAMNANIDADKTAAGNRSNKADPMKRPAHNSLTNENNPKQQTENKSVPVGGLTGTDKATDKTAIGNSALVEASGDKGKLKRTNSGAGVTNADTAHKTTADNSDSTGRNRTSSVVSDTAKPGSSIVRPGTRNNQSRQSQRALFSKKDGEPVYVAPEIEESVTPRLDTGNEENSTKMQGTAEQKGITAEAWTEQKPEAAKPTGKGNKSLPTVFATPSVHKKKAAPEEVDPEANLESVASKFWERINETESENKRLKEDNTAFQGKLHASQEKERKAVDENVLLRGEMKDLTAQYHKSKLEGNELRKKISNINAEHQKFIKQLEYQSEELKKDIENGKADIEKMQEDIRKRELELAKVKSENSIEIAKCKTEIERCQALVADKEQVEKRNKELKAKETSLEKMRSENVAEIEKLSNDITKLREEIDMLKAENEKLKTERSEREEKESDIKKSVIEMEQLYDKMLKAKLKAESAQRALETEVDLLKKEKEFSVWDAERLKQQIVDLEKRMEAMKASETTMQKLIKDKQVHITDLQKQIADLKNANAKQLEDIADLKDESKVGQVQNAKYDEMQKAHRKLLDENKRLRTQLAHKTIMETNNDSQKDELQNRLDRTNDKLDEAKERIRKMEGWLDEIYTNKDMLGGDITARLSTVSLPDIAQSVISEPSPRNTKKPTVGYGVPYANRYKNRHK